ncbi:lipopolysaccharide assembly protein LapA domain-containing protein [Sneathiella chinensis]|uniref:Lipopolysaccharide assembly protein A domain-containing protein n=1 Tax=Sneathiella chinensis TaxID=349750 RepID=A0ABQ5TYR4_9PROT|nr:lipopolysaccharide assembly protein LapA domain-containing protein [Sneathiella chinensis]GLQ04972.1 hypothetical protein GCM10007924_01930 [Sneathiella chinensis]
MKKLSWLFVLPLALVIILLSIGNREAVTFSLDPLPFVMDIPLYLLMLGSGLLGLVLGAIRTKIADGRTRAENRANKREVLRLQGEVTRLNRELAERPGAEATDTPTTRQLTDQRPPASN